MYSKYIILLPLFIFIIFTEASKKILQYLAQCSGHRGDVDRVKNRLLKSNPVLEVWYRRIVVHVHVHCLGRINLLYQ